jgi:hypothetical protein
MPDGKALLVETVKPNRGAPPPEPLVPTGPHVQESLGGAAPMATLEDMWQNPHDEDLFEYYATSQLAVIDLATGKMTPIGNAGIVESARISPDGKNLLVTTVHRPFSYLHAVRSFPREIEVWDRAGSPRLPREGNHRARLVGEVRLVRQVREEPRCRSAQQLVVLLHSQAFYRLAGQPLPEPRRMTRAAYSRRAWIHRGRSVSAFFHAAKKALYSSRA